MGWEDNVRKVVPYTPGEQPARKVIKLNTNECPYPPAPAVEKALRSERTEVLRLYPEPDNGTLVRALAGYHGVKESQVFVGVGSDDVIAQAFLTFFHSGKKVLFPDVTYSFYPVWADLYCIPYETVPLDADFRIRPADYKKENGGIIFPNPNAPTGILEPLTAVEEIVSANPDSVVMVDEAYVDFAGEGVSALSLLPKYENLMVIRTFSKSRSLAGLRIGYAIGSEKMIKYLNDVKFSVNSYTMNRPSLELGASSVEDDAYFKATVAKVAATRERLKKELAALGFSFPDAKGNFVFATHKEKPAAEIYAYLKTRDIFVRYFNLPRIDNYLRITVGTEEETDALITALKEYLG